MKKKIKHYYNIVIPAQIWSDNRLSLIERVVLAEIDYLDNMPPNPGCWARNEHLAEALRISESSVSKAISNLETLGLIHWEDFNGRIRVLTSNLTLAVLDKEGNIIPYDSCLINDKRQSNILSDAASDNIGGIDNNIELNKDMSNSKELDDNTSTKKKQKLYDKDSQEYILAEYLMNRIMENFPKYKMRWKNNLKTKTLQKWARPIDLMIRKDKHSPQEILDMIDWVQDNKFWKINILSTGKLREKFFDLIAKKENGTTNRNTPLTSSDPGLTKEIITMFKILISSPDDYEVTTTRRNKFVLTTEKMIKFFERSLNPITGLYRIPRTAWVDYLKECMIQSYKNKGDIIHPGHLCAQNTWDTLMPQYLQDLGCWQEFDKK